MCRPPPGTPKSRPISFISMNTYAKALFPVLFEPNLSLFSTRRDGDSLGGATSRAGARCHAVGWRSMTTPLSRGSMTTPLPWHSLFRRPCSLNCTIFSNSDKLFSFEEAETLRGAGETRLPQQGKQADTISVRISDRFQRGNR